MLRSNKLLFLLLMPLIALGQSGWQKQQRLTFSRALKILEEQHEIYFIYDADLIKNIKFTVTPELTSNSEHDIKNFLHKYNLDYKKLGDKTIAIIPSKSNYHGSRLTGTVYGFDGAVIPWANIFLKGTPYGCSADRKGQFCLENIPEGKYTVVAQVIGYFNSETQIEIINGQHIKHDFFLQVDVLNMSEIVTVASRSNYSKLESSVAVTTLNAGQISNRPKQSTADLLKAIPGFYVESSGGEAGNNLYPRGIPQDGSYRYVAMYEDGLPIFPATELDFLNIDVFMRVDETISGLEGLRGGPASVIAGNAPGGIINFISKTGGNHLQGLAKISIGSDALKRFDINYGGPVGENWKFNIGGFLRYSEGVRSPDFIANRGGQLKANLTWLTDDGYMRLSGKYLNDRNIFYLPIPLQNPDDPHSINNLNANYGTLTSSYMDDATLPTPDGRKLESNISDGIHPELHSFGLEMRYGLGDDFYLQNKNRYTGADFQFNAIFSLDNPFDAAFFAEEVKELDQLAGFAAWQYRYAGTDKVIENPGTLNENGLVARNGLWSVDKPLSSFVNDFQLQKDWRSHQTTLGWFYSEYRVTDFWYWQNILSEVKNAPRQLDLVALDEQGNVIAQVTDNGFEQYGSFYVNAASKARVNAIYINDEWRINDKMRLDGGVRFEQAVFSGKVEDTANNYTVNDGQSWAEQNVIYGNGQFWSYRQIFSEWAMSLGINYTIEPNVAVYTRLSRGFRMPDFEQWIFSQTRGHSQYDFQSEAGVKVAYPGFSLFATFFANQLNNIPFVDEIFEDGRIIKQQRSANSQTIGLEIESVWTVLTGLNLSFTGTLQAPRLKDRNEIWIDPENNQQRILNLDGKTVRRIPQLMFNVMPSYSFDRFNIYSNIQYIGKRFTDDANTAVLPAYSIYNAGASYELIKERLSVSVHVSNITNTVGLTEGNPRMEQILAHRNNEIFMARPILGRAFTAHTTVYF